MPTNKQRREAARRKLERQLEARQQRAKRRQRANIIASVLGAVVVVAVVLALVFVGRGGGSDTASGSGSSTPGTPTAPSSSPSATPSVSYPAATGASVTFNGVTIKGATDLKGKPGVTSKSSTNPTKLEYKDLVVGKGAAATPTSTVDVQYIGVLYKNGKAFDNSWDRGMPAEFPLTGVVKGFTYGIGGTTGVPPMKIGGRRVVIFPSSLGYMNDTSNPAIPAGSSLVFVIDLVKIASAGSSSPAAPTSPATSGSATDSTKPAG